jgi:hypothetical protein
MLSPFRAQLEVAMSLKPTAIPPVPEMTSQVARAAFPTGNPYLILRQALSSAMKTLRSYIQSEGSQAYRRGNWRW